MNLYDAFFGKKGARATQQQNWELPGQWGATTTLQKDILRKLRDWRDRPQGPGDSEYYQLPEHFYEELQKMEATIRQHQLDQRLLTELARAVHDYYTSRKLWDHAAAVAEKYHL